MANALFSPVPPAENRWGGAAKKQRADSASVGNREAQRGRCTTPTYGIGGDLAFPAALSFVGARELGRATNSRAAEACGDCKRTGLTFYFPFRVSKQPQLPRKSRVGGDANKSSPVSKRLCETTSAQIFAGSASPPWLRLASCLTLLLSPTLLSYCGPSKIVN